MPIQSVTIEGGNTDWTIKYSDSSISSPTASLLAAAKFGLLADDYGKQIKGQLTSVQDQITQIDQWNGLLTGPEAWVTTGQVPPELRNDVVMSKLLQDAKIYQDAWTTGFLVSVPQMFGTTELRVVDKTLSGFQSVTELMLANPPAGAGYVSSPTNQGFDLYVADFPGVPGTTYRKASIVQKLIKVDDMADATSAFNTVSEASSDLILKKIEGLTQVSQSQQAYLQSLMADYNKFLGLVTSTFQRRERELEGILGRF